MSISEKFYRSASFLLTLAINDSQSGQSFSSSEQWPEFNNKDILAVEQ